MMFRGDKKKLATVNRDRKDYVDKIGGKINAKMDITNRGFLNEGKTNNSKWERKREREREPIFEISLSFLTHSLFGVPFLILV